MEGKGRKEDIPNKGSRCTKGVGVGARVSQGKLPTAGPQGEKGPDLASRTKHKTSCASSGRNPLSTWHL